jgi:hypothetical protein
VTPSLQVHLKDEWQETTLMVGYRELGLWTGLVRNLIGERRVVHTGEQLLSEHMTRAVASRTETGFALSTARSPGPIESARCAVWAIALVTVPKAVPRKPQVARPRVNSL